MSAIVQDAIAAKAASRLLAVLDSATRNDALYRMASSLEQSSDALLTVNREDVEEARAQSLSSSSLTRMTLTTEKVQQMAVGLRAVAALEDPVGKVLLRSELDEGLELEKITTPFGVIAAIVEARPDAVTQLCALALKSGNALMIKAGTEISRTTRAILAAFAKALESTRIPPHAFTNVEGREATHELLALQDYVDLVVPRGSSDLVRFVAANTRIPVIGHADGVCHIYVETSASREMAISLILDAKTQAPATCNAVETVLVDRVIASEFLPVLFEKLRTAGVKVRGCAVTRAVCGQAVELVEETEWHTEYADLTLAIRVVPGMEAAIGHIETFGSHHTDCIVTEDDRLASRFLRSVDSAGVFHNVSTRFADGYRYGFGAEVGIATGKLHARGPVGLEGLVTYKYVLAGNGQCVGQYVGANARRFKHSDGRSEMA
ncbi:MAG TPA: glutamate-5-semialdehyde dehydrogenase [Terriglobales bacterium]|jgi:glutamate-5-semialdehyde dehydrogenase|nr:glutamate-5-semialdehyde dehydrogenase [Terriglobales bacterium]